MNVYELSDDELLYLDTAIHEAKQREKIEREIVEERNTCVRCKKRDAPKFGFLCKPCRQDVHENEWKGADD